MINISDLYKNKVYHFKPCHTPLKEQKKDPACTRSHKSFIKDHHQKISMMLDMNKKYQQELVNNEFYKIR